MTTITVILIVLAAIVISSAITSFVTSRKMRAKVTYMLDALEDKELISALTKEASVDGSSTAL